MMRLGCLLFSLALMCLLQTSVDGQEKKDKAKVPKEEFKAPPARPIPPPAPSFKHLDGQRLVFVVNGVGGSTILSDNLMDVNTDLNLHLRIQMVPWTRTLSSHEDLVDCEAQMHAAHKIAQHVIAIRKGAPNAEIYLMGHSAGGHVVLAAGGMLPAKSVDRISVFHPAVSTCYDLVPALKASKGGIDNFFSPNDGVLDAERAHYRNADGQPGEAAGKFGFHPVHCEKKDRDLFRGLRQYRWNEELCGSGGHYAWCLRHTLKKAVVPVVFSPPCFHPLPLEPPKMKEKK